MLKDIRSSYFINKLFSYIQERQKLKLIKYNKSLQKNMNISILIISISKELILYLNQME